MDTGQRRWSEPRRLWRRTMAWACSARLAFGPARVVARSSRGGTSFRLAWWLGLSFGTGSGWELVWPSYWQVRLSLAWACSARPVFGPAGVVAWPSRGATSFRLARSPGNGSGLELI